MYSCLRSPLRIYFICGVFSLLAVAFIGVVGYDLFVRGPMSWHIAQPSALEGGLEALLLGCLICVASVFRRRWLVVMAVVGALLYLRRHNAELTVLVGWLFWELLSAIGRSSLHRLGQCKGVDDLTALLAGICIWSMTTFFLSFFHLAYPILLLVLLFVCGSGAILLNKSSLGIIRLYQCARPDGYIQSVLFSVTVTWVIILAARTQNVVGHDTLWYLGRSDVLLAPTGTIFQSLGLVSPVHYFPKLWETLLLSVTGFDQLRVQAGVTVGLLLLSAAAIWKICEKLALSATWCHMAALLVLTVPAWANTALQLKSDVISTFLLLMMLLKLGDWFSQRTVSSLFYAMAAASLAVSCKYTAIPFVFFSFIFVVLQFYISPKVTIVWKGDAQRRAAIVVFVLAVCVALIFVYRTWLLTGVPTVGPDPLLKIWLWLGFVEREPAGTLNWTKPQVWGEVPRMLYEWLFAPNYMPKIRITWQGNYWFLFCVLGVLAASLGFRDRMKVSRSFTGLMIFLSLVGLAIAIAWRYHVRGGDGNYYMFPLGLITCLSLASFARRLGHFPSIRATACVVVVLFSLFSAAQSFLVAAWSTPGTRVLDVKFGGQPFNGGEWRENHLKRRGLLDISDYLMSEPKTTRVVSHGLEQNAALLPVPTESLLSVIYARREYAVSLDAMLSYFQRFDIQYFLLADESRQIKHLPVLRQLRQYMSDQAAVAVRGEGVTLYKVPARVDLEKN